MLDLDDALEQLSEEHERPSKALELYYFTGLTLEETGEALGISAATAMRDVRFAKAWLAREWSGSMATDRVPAPQPTHRPDPSDG